MPWLEARLKILPVAAVLASNHCDSLCLINLLIKIIFKACNIVALPRRLQAVACLPEILWLTDATVSH